MFFTTGWQGVVFGVVTTVALAVIGSFFARMWRKYEDVKPKEVHDPHAH